MSVQSIKEVLKNVSNDNKLNDSIYISFDINIEPLLEDSIMLLDTFQYLLGVSTHTATMLSIFAGMYDGFQNMEEVKTRGIKELNDLKNEFPEKEIRIEQEKKKFLTEFDVPEKEFFLSALGKTTYRVFDEIIKSLYLSYKGGKVSILGEWNDTETYILPLEFIRWAKLKGYEMPDVVEKLYIEENNIKTFLQNQESKENQENTEDELPPKEYAEKLIAQGLHEGGVMKKMYEKYKFPQWRCAVIVLGGDIREVGKDENEREKYKQKYIYHVKKYKKL